MRVVSYAISRAGSGALHHSWYLKWCLASILALEVVCYVTLRTGRCVLTPLLTLEVVSYAASD